MGSKEPWFRLDRQCSFACLPGCADKDAAIAWFCWRGLNTQISLWQISWKGRCRRALQGSKLKDLGNSSERGTAVGYLRLAQPTISPHAYGSNTRLQRAAAARTTGYETGEVRSHPRPCIRYRLPMTVNDERLTGQSRSITTPGHRTRRLFSRSSGVVSVGKQALASPVATHRQIIFAAHIS